MKFYSDVVDVALLIVEKQSTVERASQVIPTWWGIWQAKETQNGAIIEVIRIEGKNPAPNPLSIAQLIWRDEAYTLLERYDLHAGLRSATRWRLWEKLATELPLGVLRKEVREIIKARPGW